jgi:Kyakuja-Dileera-Zisupton transposase
MDYLFASAVLHTMLLLIIISYDIACQWFVNLKKHMEDHWPEELQVGSAVTLCPQIPKLHEPGHHKVGHKQYSFNYALGLGMTDGECHECIWASHNTLGNATKTPRSWVTAQCAG